MEIRNFTKNIILVLTLGCLFSQCRREEAAGEGGTDYPSRETFVAIDSCMGYMISNPKLAHHMLDSLREAQLMTQQRSDYYHAMIIFSGENNADSALTICDGLLEGDDMGDDKYLEEEICVLATDITSARQRHLETLRYAHRGIAICHGDEKMRGDEATLMGRVGAAEQALGRTEQARQTYAGAYKLLQGTETFADLVALISLKKKEATLCLDQKEYDQSIGICHDILKLVERFDNNPQFVPQRPETMQKHGPATQEFADFYQCQMYNRIARAHRLMGEEGMAMSKAAATDSVRAYMRKWSQTHASKSKENQATALPELFYAGMTTEFNNARQPAAEMYRSDSLSSDYVEYLRLMARDADVQGHLAASNDYLRRALVVSDSLRKQDMMRTLSEQMSINMVQEQKLARQDAEYQLKKHRVIILIMILLPIVLLIIIGIVMASMHQIRNKRHIIEMAQNDLNESKAEIQELLQKLEGDKPDRAAMNAQALFERIESVMIEQKLYLNPDLDIRMLSEAACSSRSVVSATINTFTGKPFRQWISEYRLQLFERMLHQDPDASIDILMLRCGYKDQSTFRRQFKLTYGVTPGEYKKKLKEGHLR